jgi:HEAT repeat protein
VEGNWGNEVFSRNVLAKLVGTPVNAEDFGKKLDGGLKHFWLPDFEFPLEGDEGENECLRSLLAGPPAVRKLAAERLRELADDSWAELVTGGAEDFSRLLNTPCGADILATAFFGKDSSSQMQVVEAATGQSGDAAPVLLLTALRHGEKVAREAAAAALVSRGISDVVPEILRQLADGVHTTEAMLVLGRLGDRRATAPLIERLTKGDCDEAAAAAEGLRHLGDPRAIGPLTEVLFRSYEDWGKVDTLVRMSVDGTVVKGGAIALSQARDDRHRVGIAMLMGSLANTPREQVGRTRGAACAALARLCDEPTRTELARRVAEELGETPGAEALGIVQATLRAQRDA